MAEIKDVMKTGSADKIVGGVTIIMAGVGVVGLGRKLYKGVGAGIDKVFPKKEREEIAVEVRKEEEK